MLRRSSKVACETDLLYFALPQKPLVSLMRADFDLMKIVHGFRWRETVLFEFVRGAVVRRDASFRAPYIMKRFNQLGELCKCRWN
jgi:hypothetical protein